MKPVSLRDVAGELTLLNNEVTGYINVKTGEMLILTDDEIRALENGTEDRFYGPWMTEEMLQKVREVLKSDDYIELPSSFDINDYQIMERFCLTRKNEALRDELLDAIHRKGAFRRFRSIISREDIEDDWYRFRDEKLKEIAANFLEAHDIPFTDDT